MSGAATRRSRLPARGKLVDRSTSLRDVSIMFIIVGYLFLSYLHKYLMKAEPSLNLNPIIVNDAFIQTNKFLSRFCRDEACFHPFRSVENNNDKIFLGSEADESTVRVKTPVQPFSSSSSGIPCAQINSFIKDVHEFLPAAFLLAAALEATCFSAMAALISLIALSVSCVT